MRQTTALFLFIFGSLLSAPLFSANVVVTVKPLHSLVAALTEGVLEPELLMKGKVSPHTFSMRPSQRQMLERADVIIYTADTLESTFADLLQTLGERKNVIEAIQSPKLQLRTYSSVEASGHHHHEHQHQHHLSYDPHIWLEPSLMAVFVVRVFEELSMLLPQERDRLQQNTDALLAKLESLDQRLRTDFLEVKDIPFMTYHDAYGYLVERYQLSYEGNFSTGHGQSLSAKQLKSIEQTIRQHNVQCLFEEPQYRAPLIARVKKLTGARSAELDPLGQDLAAGSSHYFQLMTSLSRDIRACLEGN